MVEPERDELQKLVYDRMAELQLSSRDAEKRSHGMASHAVFNRIRNGSYRGTRLSARAIAGVALALEIPERIVLAAAESSARPQRWDALVARFARLDQDLQERVIKTLAAAYEEQDKRDREERKRRRPLQ